MLTINDLKIGVVFLYNNQPYKVLEASHLKKAQSAGMMQVKIKNLITGNVLATTLKSSDRFEEADVSRETFTFLYEHRGQFWFAKPNQPKQRFFLTEEQITENRLYLKKNTELQILFFKGKPIGIELPIKMDFVVIEAPPGIKGDTAQGNTKMVTIETGAGVRVPLFIQAGDVIRINTETGEYVERVEKATTSSL
jgi:elongation factor P